MILKGTKYRWECREEPHPEEESIRSSLGCPSWVARYLTGIGVASPNDAGAWLNPRLQHLPLPSELPDLERAVVRIREAVMAGERIAVYGDYDVDGLTATFLLYDFLRRSGARVMHYVPDRLRAGYGLHEGAIHELHRNGVRLIITVDCGVSGHEQIEEANRLGMDVVVTDHHLLPAKLPAAFAIVNPKRLPGEHSLFNLAGVGVAFYLAVALRSHLRAHGYYRDGNLQEPNMREYMDLTALGTVADLMPLQGVNRILVHHGLMELSRGERIAVEALRRVAGFRERKVSPWDIHFRYAPRINAASRLGRQDLILEWLSSREIETASALANRMEQLNRRRADLEEEILQSALVRIDGDTALQEAGMLVLAEKNWHAGVLGIVASRLVERYKKPAILLTWKEGHWEGSGRSLEGFHIYGALQHCGHLLDRFGGHALAVGLKVSGENLEGFRSCMAEYAARVLDGPAADPKLSVHGPVSLSQVDEGMLAWLDSLGPFGCGCPEPVFWAESLKVHRQEVIQEKHLRLVLGNGQKRFPAIAFRMAPYLPGPVDRLDACAFVPTRQFWAGQATIQLRIVDFKAPPGI